MITVKASCFQFSIHYIVCIFSGGHDEARSSMADGMMRIRNTSRVKLHAAAWLVHGRHHPHRWFMISKPLPRWRTGSKRRRSLAARQCSAGDDVMWTGLDRRAAVCLAGRRRRCGAGSRPLIGVECLQEWNSLHVETNASSNHRCSSICIISMSNETISLLVANHHRQPTPMFLLPLFLLYTIHHS